MSVTIRVLSLSNVHGERERPFVWRGERLAVGICHFGLGDGRGAACNMVRQAAQQGRGRGMQSLYFLRDEGLL